MARPTLLLLVLLSLCSLSSISLAESTDGVSETNAGHESTKTEETAKAERKLAAKKRKLMQESCLTLVRSMYKQETDRFKDFVEAHPTQDKNRLLSKILSMMMLRCESKI